MRRLTPLAVILLAGCSSLPSSINPVSWWHDLQGGKIAEERPPPPGADQPYPNLATVPPKPAQPDRAAMASIANSLIADRSNAQRVAAAAPLADPSSPSASPGLFGRGTSTPPAPPPPPGAEPPASAVLPAADAPPPPPSAAPPSPAASQAAAAPPSRAPVGAVQSAPLAPPGATTQAPSVEAAAPPPLPGSPPPPPDLPGVRASTAPSTVAVAEPPPAPAAPRRAAPVPANPAETISVSFPAGSDSLPDAAEDTLRQLAGRRGSGVIAVTGYGDAASNDPNAQAAALTLGLSRARAMAAALASAGVPSAALQVDAAAVGRGGTARLVQ